MTMKTRFSQTLRTWQTDLPRARLGAQKRKTENRLSCVSWASLFAGRGVSKLNLAQHLLLGKNQ
jgi:hypothetical protein